MVKQQSSGKNRKLFFVVLGLFLIGITTTIVMNGTAILQKFGANAYVPNPIIFKTYTEVKKSTSNAVANATNFYKIEEMFPVTYGKSRVDGITNTSIELINSWKSNNSATNKTVMSMLVVISKNNSTTKTNAFWPRYCMSSEDKSTCYNVSKLLPIHRFDDSIVSDTDPYLQQIAGMADPYGYTLTYKTIGNNPANCTKAYLQSQKAKFVKADGSADLEGYFWPNLQWINMYYPKRSNTYFVSEPACFVPITGEARAKTFEKIADTRYDKSDIASKYAFQTGNIVMITLNHSGPINSVIERMYFTDNSASYGSFSKRYCVIKGASDNTHCTKSLSGGYRGIDIMKNGRLYNIFAFEQYAFSSIKTNLSASAQKSPVVGGIYAYQWWTQTLDLNTASHWDFDGVNGSGTPVSRDIPMQGSEWQVGNITKK